MMVPRFSCRFLPCFNPVRSALSRNREHLVVAPVVDEGVDQVEEHEAHIQHQRLQQAMSSHQDITGRATISRPLETESMQHPLPQALWVWPDNEQQLVDPDVVDIVPDGGEHREEGQGPMWLSPTPVTQLASGAAISRPINSKPMAWRRRSARTHQSLFIWSVDGGSIYRYFLIGSRWYVSLK
jgi:hypothetical protein